MASNDKIVKSGVELMRKKSVMALFNPLKPSGYYIYHPL
jgi:hypothetical protein